MDGSIQFEKHEDGSVSYYPEQPPPDPESVKPGENLASRMNQSTLDAVANSLTENIAFDQEGATGWQDMAEEIYDLLGLGSEADDDAEYDGADRSSHTLMLNSLLRFQSKAISTLLPSDDMAVRTEPSEDLDAIDDEDAREERREELNKAQRRVERFYTDYLFRKLPSYEEDTDMVLHDMGLIGVGVRKIVVDPSRKSMPVVPEHVRLGDLTVSYQSKNFRVGRFSHRIDMPTGTLIRRIQAGQYRAVRLSDMDTPLSSGIQQAQDEVHGVSAAHLQNSETHSIYEVYTDLFLDDDPHPQRHPRPYIVTIHAATREVLAIQRNWDESDPDETPIEHFVAYVFHPGRNAITGIGLGQILLQTTRALRAAQRRLLEAAYLQNHPSGFKLSNFSIRTGETKVRPGEFIDVDAPTGNIRDAIMSHTFQGVSPGLVALMDKMEANGREMGGTASMDLESLMKSGMPAGPAMAAYEESTEFQTAVHRRLYKAHRTELELIHDRMRVVMGNQTVLFGVDQQLRPGDLLSVNVLPYMKPGQASRQKVIMEAQAAWDIARDSPDVLDRRAAAEAYVRALGSSHVDALILPNIEEEETKPADPVTEYNAVLAGRPVAAGLAQNHQAHIDAHTAQMRMLQNSSLPIEQGEAAMAVLSAHIAEHMGQQMVAEAASLAGIGVEQIGPDVPPEVEAQIAPQLAQAVMEMEQRRAEAQNPQSNEKLEIERLKQDGSQRQTQMREESALLRERLKQEAAFAQREAEQAHAREMAELKARHARELQEIKDAAAMDREIEDNVAALTIAREKAAGRSSASATAGARAGASATAGADAGDR